MDESPISGEIRDVYLQWITMLETPPPPPKYHGPYKTSGYITTNICGYSNRCTSAKYVIFNISLVSL
jgi:hypothetical protein